jgi:hypothetical protein
MKGKKRVIFSPHHSLHLFPFHAARWEQGFVRTEFAVSYTPNFSSLLLPWNKRPENRILAIGISQFTDCSVPALRNVEADVQTIRSYYEAAGAKVEVLLGPEATRARIGALRDSGELSKFRCIHLGTHGRSVFETPNEPLESSLQLQNGRFDAMDIASLQLSADLVVLSACNSGQRAIRLRNLGEAPRDDIFGLQSALFKSGARSILGSLWIVHVDTASFITREFHPRDAIGRHSSSVHSEPANRRRNLETEQITLHFEAEPGTDLNAASNHCRRRCRVWPACNQSKRAGRNFKRIGPAEVMSVLQIGTQLLQNATAFLSAALYAAWQKLEPMFPGLRPPTLEVGNKCRWTS